MIRFFEQWIFPVQFGVWQEKLVAHHPMIASFRPFSLLGVVLFFHGLLWLIGYALPVFLSIPLVSFYYSFLIVLLLVLGGFFGTIIYFNRCVQQLDNYPLSFKNRLLLFGVGVALSLLCFSLPFSGVGALLQVQQNVYQAEQTGGDLAGFKLLLKKYPSYSLNDETRYLAAIGAYRDDHTVDYLAAFTKDSFERQYVIPILDRITAEYELIIDEEAQLRYLDDLAIGLLDQYQIKASERSFIQLKDRLSMAAIANTQPVYWSAKIIYGVLLLAILFGSFVAYTNFREVATVFGLTLVILGLLAILLNLLALLLTTLGVSGFYLPLGYDFPTMFTVLSIPLLGIYSQIRLGYQFRLSRKLLVFAHLLLLVMVFSFGASYWTNLLWLLGGTLLFTFLGARLRNLPLQKINWRSQNGFATRLLSKNLAANYPLLWEAQLPLALLLCAGLFLLSLFLGLNDTSNAIEILESASVFTGTDYSEIIFVGLIPFVLWVRQFNYLRNPSVFSTIHYLRLSIVITGLTILMFVSLSPYLIIRDHKLKDTYSQEILREDLQALVTVDELINDKYYFNRRSALGIPALSDTVENTSLYEQLGLHTFSPPAQLDSNQAKSIFVRYGVAPPQPFQFSNHYDAPYQEARDSLKRKMEILLNKQFLVAKNSAFLYNISGAILLIIFLILFRKGLSLRYWTGLYLLGLFFFLALDIYNPTKGVWNSANLLTTLLVFTFLLASIYYQIRHKHRRIHLWQYVATWLLGYCLFINYVESSGIYGQELWHLPILIVISLLFFLFEYEVRKRIVYTPQGLPLA